MFSYAALYISRSFTFFSGFSFNKLKCSLKTSVSLVLATEHLKLLGVIKVTSSPGDLFYTDTSLIRTGSTVVACTDRLMFRQTG